jgi:hypothetical protein
VKARVLYLALSSETELTQLPRPGLQGLLSIAAKDAHELTRCCILKLCITSGEALYRQEDTHYDNV